MMDKHTALPFSLERKQIVDFLSFGKSKHTAYAVLELDITGMRSNIRAASRNAKRTTSLTGYLVYCFAQAVNADKMIQGYRKGNKLIVFDDVDVSTMVERTINGSLVPVGYVLRKANSKSVFEISEEIKAAKNGTSSELVDSPEMMKHQKLIKFVKKFGFLRRWFLKRMFNDPFKKKKFNGTVGFSSMGMFSYNIAGWIIPITPHVLTAMVGGIREVPSIVGGELVKREVVDMTIAMDHDILDGAQTARFVERLRKILLQGIDVEPPSDQEEGVLELNMTHN